MGTILTIIAVGILFYIFAMVMLYCQSSQKRKEMASNKGAMFMSSMKHLTGLPIGEGIICNVYAFEDKISIEGSGTEFAIPRQKISSVNITSETEIQNHTVSSVGGAVGGALLFGSVGAIIGGRAKNKQTTMVDYFLIISYLSNNESKYVAFNLGTSTENAHKFVKEYRTDETKTMVEL